MELNQLRYFLAVTEHGGFSKAAANCFVTQSTLSELIQKLEKDVGKRLLERTHRMVVPTEAGKILAGRAKRILAQIEIARREIRNSGAYRAGRVTFGILPTIAPYFLPAILRPFQKRHPNIDFVIHENVTAHVLQLIEENKLDFGIVSLPIKDHGFDTEKLFTEDLLVALPCDSPLLKKEKIGMKDLQNENFILLQEGHCLGDQVLDFCNRHDFCPRITFRSGQLTTVQAFIRAGTGISLIPQMAAQSDAQISYRLLQKPRPKRAIVVVSRSKRPLKKSAQDFLQHLRQTARSKAFH
jgi:LysR family hydrogen peroxide-inducible transcriptional activator